MPVQAPPDWSVWTTGDGVRVATPVPLRLLKDNDPLPGFDIKNYQASHNGVRYQVTVSAEPRRTNADRIEIYFNGMLTNFAASGQFRTIGSAERLTVEGHPGIQAQFADGSANMVIRAVHYEEQVVALAIFKEGSVEESEPAIGNFLNSLRAIR